MAIVGHNTTVYFGVHEPARLPEACRDEVAFLASIEAQPDNELVKDIFRDWLEERGRSRFLWTTLEGRVIPVDRIEDRHLWNILRFIIKSAVRKGMTRKQAYHYLKAQEGLCEEATKREFAWEYRYKQWFASEEEKQERLYEPAGNWMEW